MKRHNSKESQRKKKKLTKRNFPLQKASDDKKAKIKEEVSGHKHEKKQEKIKAEKARADKEKADKEKVEKEKAESKKADKPIDLKETIKAAWKDNIKDALPLGRYYFAKPLPPESEARFVLMNELGPTFYARSWEDVRDIAILSSQIETIIPPSKAEKWMRCPGSALVKSLENFHKFLNYEIHHNGGLPKGEELIERWQTYHANRPSIRATESSQQGTKSHQLAHAMIDALTHQRALSVEESRLFEDDFWDASNLLQYAAYVVKDYNQQGFNECDVEVEVPIPSLHPDIVARPDLVLRKKDKIKVIDFKSGSKRVDVHDNYQLMIYAFATLSHFGYTPDLKNLEIQIVQPSINYYGKQDLKVKEVIDWGTQVLIPAVQAVQNPTLDDLHEGEWCRNCSVEDCALRMAQSRKNKKPHPKRKKAPGKKNKEKTITTEVAVVKNQE